MQNQFTSISNRGILLSKTILSLARIGLVVFIISIIISILLSFNKEFFLSITYRVILVSVSLVPLIISLYTFYIFESIYPNRSFSKTVFVKLLVFTLYLFIPATAITYRFDGFTSKALTVLNFIPILLFMFSPFLTFKKLEIISVIRDILFNTWKNTPFSINTNYFSLPQIFDDRSIEYTNSKTLSKFQASFVNSSIEDKHISQYIKTTSYLKNCEIKNILDIGGYDGAFTSNLLEKLNIQNTDITLIDPVNKLEIYQRNLKNFSNSVKYKKKKFEEFIPEEHLEFDLIIASHSLYSFLDKDENKVEHSTNQILKLLKPNGLILLIFGSSNSPAYAFKNKITEYILNYSNSDMTSEKYINYLQKKEGIYFKHLIIDNYINLTELINNDELFSEWTSYFARIPTIKDSYLIKQMKKIALYYSTKPNELPECVNTLNRNEKNDYLLHKTIGILISTTANNVYKK